MTYFYLLKYCIWKNNRRIINTKILNFREIVDFIIFENKKHGDNFEIMDIKKYIRSFRI